MVKICVSVCVMTASQNIRSSTSFHLAVLDAPSCGRLGTLRLAVKEPLVTNNFSTVVMDSSRWR